MKYNLMVFDFIAIDIARGRRTTAASAINVLGLLMSGFYILIAKGVVLVYECRANPNGVETMQVIYIYTYI
jgi:hypothetical protein